MDIVIIAEQIVILFSLMGVGAICSKTGIITTQGRQMLSSLVMNIGLPGLIISSVLGGVVADFNMVMTTLLFALIGYIPALALGMIVPRMMGVPREKRGVYCFICAFQNASFMGYPLIDAIYGAQGIFYNSLYVIVFVALVYSVGILLMSSGQKSSPNGRSQGKAIAEKIIKNPAFLTSRGSVVLYLMGIRANTMVLQAASFLGNICTPLSMLILGATLANLPFRSSFCNLRLWVVCSVKLLAIPLVTLPVLLHFLTDPVMIGVLTMVSAMPVAANATMMAVEYGNDSSLTAQATFLSTLLSIITLPLIALALLHTVG